MLVSAGNANGDRSHIAAGIANVCIAGVQSEALLFLIDAEPGCGPRLRPLVPAVPRTRPTCLAAMGVPREVALGSLRLSLGHTSVASDMDRAIEVIAASVERLDRFGGG